MKRALIALLALVPALMGQRASDVPVYNKRRLDALLSRDNCTREGGCDLAAGTTIGGSPIGGGGSGEANTASNLGGGLANWDSKSGVDLRFNSFAAADFDLASNVFTIDGTKWLTIVAAAAAYQPLDPDLTSIAALTTTAFGRGLLDDADATAARLSIGAVIGTNVQAWDADLDSVAAGPPGGELGGTWASPTIDDGITIGGVTLNASPTITMTQGASVTPVVEGVIEWDSDDDHIMVGASGTAVRFIPAEDFSGDATVSAAGTVTVANDSHDHTTATISGLDGGDITAGTVVAARLDGAMATDAEVAAGYQPLDSDLTSVAGLSTTTGGRSILATTPADDQVYVGDSASGGTWRSIPDCGEAGTLNYTASTNSFSCLTDGGGGGGGISYADAAAAALAGF